VARPSVEAFANVISSSWLRTTVTKQSISGLPNAYARDFQSPRAKVQLNQTAVPIGNLGLPFEIYVDQMHLFL
jgi:hypothetical protein